MSRTLFPLVQPELADERDTLPLCKCAKIDFVTGKALFRGGRPVIVEGRDAVLCWAWMALHTPRFRFDMFSWDYGCEVESLMGQPYTESLKQAEARRYVTEALTTNPYITAVDNLTVAFADGVITVTCTIATIYGQEELSTDV